MSFDATPLPPDYARIRCWACDYTAAEAIGFRGHFSRRCKQCRSSVMWSGDAEADRAESEHHTTTGRLPWRFTHETRVLCTGCRRVVAYAIVLEGSLMIGCRSCRRPVTVRPTPPPRPRPSYTADEIVALMDERWQALIRAQARQRAEVALGLRFDVFKRDGFRCRYCGRSVDDGAILHADHVIPESKGGPTTLDNLVTACFACNIGKSNKLLNDIPPVI